jgi:hypothetical protein
MAGTAPDIKAIFVEAPDLTPRRGAGGLPRPGLRGTRIGPDKLPKEIGEGGVGAISMAEQEHPVRRRVSLKIIKPGMDSERVVARLKAGRQALAPTYPGGGQVHRPSAMTGPGSPAA